jgi:hypothetical protein
MPRTRSRFDIRRRPDRCRPRLEALEARTLLSVFTVDRLTDTGEGNGLAGDLRYCITNATSGEDAIHFAVTGNIKLTHALPNLDTSVRIEGPGPTLLSVKNNTGGSYRIFTVNSGTTVAITGLTVTRGYGEGGGIYNAGSLTLRNSVVSQNDTGGYGGGIYNSGTMAILGSTISGNYAGNVSSVTRGAGIYNAGVMTISNSTVSDNDDLSYFDGYGYGAGIYNTGALRVDNSTICRNSLVWDFSFQAGGGIYNTGTLEVAHSTVAGNTAPTGGGIAGTPPQLWNTIVAGNHAHFRDLACPIISLGHNLIGDTDGGSGFDDSDLLNVDPLLGPLQDNGGPTWTRALLPGSPAIDAGDNTNAPAWDQRGPGFPRIVNGTIDIGAFEVQADSPPARPEPGPSTSTVDPASAQALVSELGSPWLSPNAGMASPVPSPVINQVPPEPVAASTALQTPSDAVVDFWVRERPVPEEAAWQWDAASAMT